MLIMLACIIETQTTLNSAMPWTSCNCIYFLKFHLYYFAVEDKRICPHTGRSTLQIGLNSTYLSPPPKSLQSSPGSRTCPWVLSTDKGRRINITFISFSSTTDSLVSGPSTSAMQCSDFLVIRDYNTTESRPICKDHRREKILYSSKSNKVAIYLRYAGSYGPGEISSRYLLKSLGEHIDQYRFCSC